MKSNFEGIYSSIPDNVKLVAVSKTKPIELLKEAYELGERNFGENRVQEIIQKHEVLPKDIHWHFIGHLQRNKVKYIAPFVHLIHSVDSIKLLKEINKCGEKHHRKISCLLQFHIAREENKHGFSENEVIRHFEELPPKEYQNIKFCGVMGMATFINNPQVIELEFKKLREIFQSLKDSYFKNKNDFKEISMGMSQDYQLAIKEGSTMIRIGSSLFGSRNA